MISIIDYGLGNIKAFKNVYDRLNIKTQLAHKASDITGAAKLILPGVGSFDHAMTLLNSSGMRDEIEKQVFINKIPIIGICVGMQMLGKSSEEGILPGLGWIDGNVKLFNQSLIKVKPYLPHMGWNTITTAKGSKLFEGYTDNPRFYFLHSYYFECNSNLDVIARTDYGISFASAVHSENVYGVQFHPEKSHSNGIQLLKNFANL